MHATSWVEYRRLGCADNSGIRLAKGHCLCYAKADSVLEPRRESTAADTSEGQQSLTAAHSEVKCTPRRAPEGPN